MKKQLKMMMAVFLSVLTIVSGTHFVADEIDIAEASDKLDTNFLNLSSYLEYLSAYSDEAYPQETYSAGVESLTENSVLSQVETVDGKEAHITDQNSVIEWKINVAKTGLYAIKVTYYPFANEDISIERELQINGKLPFSSSAAISFGRRFANNGEIKSDSKGNDIRPKLTEQSDWYTTLVGGTQDYVDNQYYFYFKGGENLITLRNGQGKMAVSGIELCQPESVPSYKEYKRELERQGIKKVEKGTIKIQGESFSYCSNGTIYAKNDNTSPSTESIDGSPASLYNQRINTVGGENWKNAKQWIEWEVNAPKSGLYKLAFRFKQNYLEGTYAARRLYVNGRVPFNEALSIQFAYGYNWQSMTLQANAEDCLIYLKKGKNSIRLENVIGNISDIVSSLNDTTKELNNSYRRILMVTGSNPDANRDYQLDKNIPQVIESFEKQYKTLDTLSEQLYEMTGDKGTAYGRLQKMSIQLKSFVKNPDSIPERMSSFRDNISDLSSWMFEVTQQPLCLDYISFLSEDSQPIKADCNFFERIWYELKRLMVSFVYDYNAVTSEKSSNKMISLWMGTNGLTGAAQTSVAGASGRDQANIIKQLVDESFTSEKKINVDIKLIDMSVLLPAVASGNGPDVAINQDQTNPVNYALRGALYSLSEFDDLPKVLERFDKSAVTPFYMENSLYALPETQTYSMMFCRTDILQELGVEPPKTWDEIYSAITVLNRNNLGIGFPNLSDNNLDIFYMMLSQQGGTVYAVDKKSTALDSEMSIDAFEKWSELYTKYNISQKIDALTRFRTGETPIIIAPFTFYNTLSASAPEVKGFWDMYLLPATVKDDGTVDRSAISATTGCVIFKNTGEVDAAWEFLKWWTDTETQLKFGKELEILYGEAGRWPTANTEAFNRLTWKKDTISKLNAQKEYIKGLDEIPGGYMTSRYIATAIRVVINNSVSPREAILDYSQKIDKEITLKRKEFGLE